MKSSKGVTMRTLVLALAGACLAVVAIAATRAILSEPGGPKSAGPAPSIPVATEPLAAVGPTAPDASARVGFIGLPPEGAAPSTPDGGEVVVFYQGPIPGDWGMGWFWLYADGRLISWREADLPVGANRAYTGFLEQRLSAESVELLRSEVLANATTGLAVPSFSALVVRDGDRLARVDRMSAQLDARLTDLASWLPLSALERSEFRAYVPFRYAVCYGGFPAGQSHQLFRILASLPGAGGELLRARGWTRQGSGDSCSEVTTKEARVIAEDLDDGGFVRGGRQFDIVAPALDTREEQLAANLEGNSRLAYLFPHEYARPRLGHIYFDPILPHGKPPTGGCCGYDPSLLRDLG